MNNIEELIKEFENGNNYPSVVTHAAKKYIKQVKHYGWLDNEFVNGYQRIKEVKITVMVDNSIQTIWYFRTVKDAHGKIGYIIDSWADHFDLQVDKEDGNTAYMMIMAKAKEVNGAKVIVERIL